VTVGSINEYGRIVIETVPAYNEKKKFHPKNAGWVGYIVEMDGWRIYVAGDTDNTKEAQKVKCDVAIVPVGGTYTMDLAEAAALVNTIHPKMAVPSHYGSVAGNETDGDEFAALVSGDIEVKILKEY